METLIRSETPSDIDAIGQVNRQAFEQDDEAVLVDALRDGGFVELSMVAEIGQSVVGHILYSQLMIADDGQTVAALALAPMAVLPEYQRQGIGSRLIETSLEHCRLAGHRIVIVLGHKDYYPRFGFSSALADRLDSPYQGESFMALEIVPGSLDGVAGQVRYAPPFNGG